jgi:hypothetical protein
MATTQPLTYLVHQQYSNVCTGIALQSMRLDLRRSFA